MKKLTIITDKIINGGGESLLLSFLESIKGKYTITVIYIGKRECVDLNTLEHFKSVIDNFISLNFNSFLSITKEINHSQTIYCYSIKAQLFLKAIRPFVSVKYCVGHNHGDASNIKKVIRALNKVTYKGIDKYIYTTKYAMATHIGVGSNKKAIVIYNGIDNKKFIFKDDFNKRNEVRFVSVNRLEPVKDIAAQIDIVSRMISDYNFECSLDIYGDGSLKKELMEEVKSRKLEGCINFLGSVDNDFIKQNLKEYDCLLATSVNEGFGLNVSEAISSGLAVLANSIPVYKELYSECPSVIFFEKSSYNPKEICGQISEITSNKEKLLRSYDIISERYSLKRFSTELESVLRL